MFTWQIATEILASPHTLIAGTTGSGKSTCLNTIICQALQSSPDKTKMLFIDLKRVELARYKNVPHSIGFYTEPGDLVFALDDIISEMEDRYKKMEQAHLYKSLEPDIYIIIDELAYTVGIKGVLKRLSDIGRLGRAANIHIIGATQDPSRKTLCSQLMQNFTNAIALRCRSAIESRQIIGAAGAEELPAYGRGLYWGPNGIASTEIPKLEDNDIEMFLKSIKKKYNKSFIVNQAGQNMPPRARLALSSTKNLDAVSRYGKLCI